jgi:hypothetical protein
VVVVLGFDFAGYLTQSNALFCNNGETTTCLHSTGGLSTSRLVNILLFAFIVANAAYTARIYSSLLSRCSSNAVSMVPSMVL